MVWYGMVWYGMVWYGMVHMLGNFTQNSAMEAVTVSPEQILKGEKL
jgi:hypothetical protein